MIGDAYVRNLYPSGSKEIGQQMSDSYSFHLITSTCNSNNAAFIR